MVIYHGGGCTPFTQINDTHLHALLQRLLIQLENRVALGKRKDMHLNGQRGIATLSRSDICDIVKTAWLMTDHVAMSKKGYEQTGPGLPLEGPISRAQVYKDLRNVFDEVDPPEDVQEIGEKLRDEANAFVLAGYPRKWSNWTHVTRLIEEHSDGEEPVPEGMEAFGYEVVHGGEDSDDPDKDDAGEDDGGLGGDEDNSGSADGDTGDEPGDDSHGNGGIGGSRGCVLASKRSDEGRSAASGLSHGSSEATEVGVGVGGVAGAAPAVGAAAAAAGGADAGPAARELELAQAMEVMIAEARRSRNDPMLRRLLEQRSGAERHTALAASGVAQSLRKRALEQREAEEKQRKAARRDEMRARVDVAFAEQRKAEAVYDSNRGGVCEHNVA